MKRICLMFVAGICLLMVAVLAYEYWVDPGSEELAQAVSDKAQQIARGKYLVRIGDCMACHTTRGGVPFAGGRAITTPFGKIFSPNLTPDVTTGIGRWNADDFWHALHNGKSRDGRFLYPAFPYTDYTRLTRADADAMFAYLQTVGGVAQSNREPELDFPYNWRFLLVGWRALYFRPGTYHNDASKSAQWNRGAYVVQGLGHCVACHSERNALGANASLEFGGGMLSNLGWYAPSLTADDEAGLGAWDQAHIVALLQSGVSPRATVFGPMAEVVARSLQHLSDEDVTAIAVYLKSLPQTRTPPMPPEVQVRHEQAEDVLKLGGKLFRDHCLNCHAENGSGMPPAYPPLAGNRAITMHSSVNSIRMVLNGGFPPSTTANPRPYGMPPFRPTLSDSEVAAVVSYIRNSWGNHAPLVSSSQVSVYRAVPID